MAVSRRHKEQAGDTHAKGQGQDAFSGSVDAAFGNHGKAMGHVQSPHVQRRSVGSQKRAIRRLASLPSRTVGGEACGW
jgi:hypothetical protein